VTKELNGLKNKATKAAKKMKESERRCMVDDDISECDCERLRGDFTTLRSTYQELIMSVGYPFVMSFEGQSGWGHKKFVICLQGL
jgi:hypothetical protein